MCVCVNKNIYIFVNISENLKMSGLENTSYVNWYNNLLNVSISTTS